MAEQTPREIAINVLSCNHHCSPSMIAIGLHDDPLCPARNRPDLEAAITAAVEHERERCAKVADGFTAAWDGAARKLDLPTQGEAIAAAILDQP